MSDQTVTLGRGADINSAASRIDALFQPPEQAEPGTDVEEKTSPEPVEADAVATDAPATQVSQPDDAEDTDTVPEGDNEAPEDQPSAEDAEADPDDDFEVPQTLAELADALEIEPEALNDLRVTVKVNGEEMQVPIGEAARGYQRQADYDAKMAEIRDERSKFDSAVNQATQLWQQRLSSLDTLVSELEAQVAGKEPDWEGIIDTYGADEYNRQRLAWDNQQKARTAAREQLEAARAQRDAEMQQATAERQADEQRKLINVMPELADATRAEAFVKDVSAYMGARGFAADEVGPTLDSILDHRIYPILQDAIKYHNLKSGEPEVKKKTKTLPKVLKANSPKGKGQIQRDKVTALSSKLRKTGRVDDAADIFKEMGL